MLKLGGNWQHCQVKWLYPCTIPSFAQACRCVQPDNKPQAQHWFGFKAKEGMVNFHLDPSSQFSLVWDHTNTLELSRACLVLSVAFPWTGASSGHLPLRAESRCLCSAHQGGRGGAKGAGPLKCTSSADWASLSQCFCSPPCAPSVFSHFSFSNCLSPWESTWLKIANFPSFSSSPSDSLVFWQRH